MAFQSLFNENCCLQGKLQKIYRKILLPASYQNCCYLLTSNYSAECSLKINHQDKLYVLCLMFESFWETQDIPSPQSWPSYALSCQKTPQWWGCVSSSLVSLVLLWLKCPCLSPAWPAGLWPVPLLCPSSLLLLMLHSGHMGVLLSAIRLFEELEVVTHENSYENHYDKWRIQEVRCDFPTWRVTWILFLNARLRMHDVLFVSSSL